MIDLTDHDLSYWVQCLQEVDQERRLRAIIVLGMMGEAAQSAVPALILSLDEEDLQIQRLILASLSEIGPATKTAAPTLIGALRNPNDLVRRRALMELARLGPEARGAVPPLRVILNDECPQMRRWAIYALGQMGPRSHPAITDLIPFLAHPDIITRALAATALRQIEGLTLTPLLDAFQKGNEELRRQIAFFFRKGPLDSPQILELLQNAHSDSDPELNRMAGLALQRRAGKSGL